MKKVVIIVFILMSSVGQSQINSDKKIYLDSMFAATTAPDYKYCRIVQKYFEKQDSYVVNDYNKAGILMYKGTYLDNEGFTKNGFFENFYENGAKKQIKTYEKNLEIGAFESWYENGNPKETGIFKIISEKESQYSIINFGDSDNKKTVTNGNGHYQYESKGESSEGSFLSGFKDGIWTGKSKIYNLSYTENYNQTKLVDGTSIDNLGAEHNYQFVEKKPEPKRGIKDFYEFIGKKFKVPDVKGLAGKLILQFIVEKDGSIIDIKIIKSIGYGADEEGIRVLEKYSKWNSGEVRGVNVRCVYQIPISIKSAE